MKRKLTILAAAIALAACSTSEETTSLVADGVARFSSEISTRVSTDLSTQNSAWEAGDVVGIYMYSDQSDQLRSDVPYSASEAATTTSFTPYGSEEAILYPNSGSVTFQAYSPYTDAEYLTIDLSDQTTEARRNMMDYMISEVSDAASYESSATAVALTFKHKMAMLRFDVTCNDTVASIDGLTCTITSGLTATQSYDKITGVAVVDTAEAGPINMLVEQTSTTAATITAIIHPEEITSAGVTFSFGGEVVATFLPAQTFEANKIYSYPVEMGSNYATIGTSTVNAWGTVNDSVDMDVDRVFPADLAYVDGVFEIYTAAGLYAFADLVNGGNGTYSTAVVEWGTGTIQAFGTDIQLDIDGVLTTDVDLGGSSSPWTAIGSSNYYTGTFDGGGYLVSGLYISGSNFVQGLFGYVGSDGVVKSVGVSGEVTGHSNIGGVVGYNNGSVTNCYNTAALSGTSNSVGGVVGQNYGSVTNCYNTAAVSGECSIGGVVGNNNGSVTNCYNTAAVWGDNVSDIGGVVGGNSGGSVTSCYWVYADGNVSYGVGSGTDTTTKYTSDYMQSAEFAALLNTNAESIDGACEWVDNSSTSGYPTLNFGVMAAEED